jgi:CRP-like cAMP-binding protein
MNNLAEILADSTILGKFTISERKALSKLAVRRFLKRGIALCQQGDCWPFVFYIVNGTLKSKIRSLDGRVFVVSHWDKGMEFWGHTVFDGEGMPATLETVEDTIGYQWQGEDVLRYAFRNNEVIWALLCYQTRLIRKRREIIHNLAFSPVARRLARILLNIFQETESPTVRRDLTLEEMATMVSSSPEVICRVLYQFQDKGFLNIDRTTLTLYDRQGLENLVAQV